MPEPKKIALTANPQPPSENSIRLRAFEIYEERGREEGHDVEDWIKAESELLGKAA